VALLVRGGDVITYAQACNDPHLFGPWFSGDTWATWRVLDKALFGEALDDDELETYTALTGRSEAPTAPISEAWLVMGRRSGKDVKAASICAYLATIGAERFDYARYLTPGERGVVQLLAVDRDQAKVCLGYLKAMFDQPMLEKLVSRQTADGLELTNRLAIEITTNDQRRVRGRTVVATVFDEVAFWRSENSASPDTDVYNAVKPSMVTIPSAMLIGISSPYARRGLLWTKHKANYGKPSSRILVAQAPTWLMNPNVPRDGEFLTEAFEEDPASAAAEFGAQFRTDVEAFVTMEVVEACVSRGIFERERKPGARYVGFVDPSGGSKDSFTLAIAHAEGRVAVLDAVRERKPPFSPEAVIEEYAALLKSYGITKITSDRYAGVFPVEAFSRYGITCEQSAKPKSDLYAALLPRINSGDADLLDVPRIVTQLVGLERRTARGGRDSIDHPPGGHDDVVNAVAGALTSVTARRGICMADYL
jgi:hypothetical protein